MAYWKLSVHVITLIFNFDFCQFRVNYRKDQLQLHQEAKQQAKELALEQEKEKQRRLDKLREQACDVYIIGQWSLTHPTPSFFLCIWVLENSTHLKLCSDF